MTSAVLAHRLADIAERATLQRVIGVEREYSLFTGTTTVDAGAIWRGLPDLGVALDPGDPHARRGSWGGVLTVDGAEAEVATAPVVLEPGCTHRVLALAAAGARRLGDRLPDRVRMLGYSTHINVEVTDRRVLAVARLIARRLALPLMLAMDRVTSPGVLVRPRPGRLEIGGEFLAGEQLRAAVALTIGVVLLAERAIGVRGLVYRLPPVPPADVRRAVERFGFYLDRRAFGPDLYAAGRTTALPGRRGGETANQTLSAVWAAARPLAAAVLADDELHLVDELAAGAIRLPMERPESDDGPIVPCRDDHHYLPRSRPAGTVAVVSATWWKALLELSDTRRRCWLTVPGRALDQVLDDVDSGRLDAELAELIGSAALR